MIPVSSKGKEPDPADLVRKLTRDELEDLRSRGLSELLYFML